MKLTKRSQVLVAETSSSSPWLEALALACGAGKVFSWTVIGNDKGKRIKDSRVKFFLILH